MQWLVATPPRSFYNCRMSRMMIRLGRRSFLLRLGAALAVGSGGAWYAWRRLGPMPTAPAAASDAPVRDFRVRSAGSHPELVVIGGDPDATVLTERAIAALGGMSRFVRSGDVVAIKPNAGWERSPAQAANTRPEVIAAIVRATRAAGAKKVIVTDSSCNDPARSFQVSGIGPAASDAGAEVVLAREELFSEVSLRGRSIDKWPLLLPVLEADKVINVPIAKHHGSAKFTGAMKNWFGVAGGDRFRLHWNMNTSIADLAAFIRPTLTIMDATRVLVRNGPKGGNLDDIEDRNTIIASTDEVAADAYACTLLGLRPDELDYLAMGQQRGLGTRNWRMLRHKLEGVTAPV